MRTRLQEALFFRQYSEEKKKKRAAAVNGGDQSNVSINGDSDSRAAVDGGDSRSPANSERSKSNCVNVGCVISKEGGNLGVKSDGKLREGLEKNQGVLIGGERDGIQEVLRKEKNVGRVDSKENCESSKRVEEKNKSVDGVVCGADDESDDSDDSDDSGGFVYLGMERDGVRIEENVGRVDSKENCESSKRVEEKNKSVDGVVCGADDESDDSDDSGGFVYLGMERDGVRIEENVGRVDSKENCESSKRVEEKIKSVDGVVCGSDDESNDSDDSDDSGGFVYLGMERDGVRIEENVGRVDSKENCESSKRVEEKNKNVDGVVCGADDESDDSDDGGVVFLGKERDGVRIEEENNRVDGVVSGADESDDGEVVFLGIERRKEIETDSDGDVVFLGIDYSRMENGVDGVVQNGVMGSNCDIDLQGSKEASESPNCDIDLQGSKEASESRDAMKSNASGSAESDSDSGDSEESEWSSNENSEACSDQDFVGSTDVDSDGSPSCSDYEDEDDEDEWSVCNGKGKEKMTEIGSVDRRGKNEMGKVGLKGRREKSPEFVYLGQVRRDGEGQELKGNDLRKEGIVEGDGPQEMIKVGLKRRREKSPEFVYLGQVRRDGDGQEELKGNDVRKEGIVDGDGEQETIEKSGRGRSGGKLNCSRVNEEKDGPGGLKRMTYSGLDLLVGCDREKNGNEEDPEGPKSVAERIHLRPRRGNKKELGSFSCPFTLSDKEVESSTSGDDDGTDSDEDERSDRSANDSKKVGKSGEKSKGKVGRPPAKRSHDRENGNDANNVWKFHEISKGKVGRPAKSRHGCAGSAAPIRVEKILADSIWQNGDVPEEELVSFQVPDLEATLPLKFRFLDEDPIPPEKPSWEIEADKLFAQMDFALAASEIGASDSSMVDSEDSLTEETESNPATSCREGKHELVLDDEIGLKCKFCPFVKMEIKHILPSFSKHPWGRREKNYWNNSDHFNFENIQFHDSASTSNSKDQICGEGTVWDIIPGIKTSMYAHQREGFEFIWKNIGGSIDLEELKKRACDGGSGCIISHAPGTGKTRLAIVFLQTFMELNPRCMPVIVAPRSMLLTWEEEFKKWKVDIPFHNLNQPEFSGRENKAAFNLLQKFGRHGQNVNTIRLVKLFSWKMGKSILGISYRLFEKLAEDGIVSADEKGGGKRKRKSKQFAEAEQVRKMLLELPGLLVLDEGHTPRNDQSLMWRALSGVQTQRRILLSGTPFQNNFQELFNTLCLVRPKFSDRIGSGIMGDCPRKRGRERRKGRGKWASLTNSIGKDAGDKLDKLRAIIDPFVHAHKGMILEENLPGLSDAMIVLNPTDLQKSLIGVFQGRNILKRDHLASLISVHPSLLLGCALSEEEGLSVNTNELETLRFDPRAGAKTHFLVELIRLSMAVKEKVLVFSQFLEPLAFIREQLKSSFGWTEGKDLLYMDGHIEAKHRQSSISLLNDSDSQVQVLLASTRACCEGISLVGASRVVLLDVVWNPSVERQAVSRAYRIGQKKVVYIYRLIMSGTMEGEKCVRQAEKDRLSELVFSSADGKGTETISRGVNDDKILQEMAQHEKISHMFAKILNQPKVSNLIDTFG